MSSLVCVPADNILRVAGMAEIGKTHTCWRSLAFLRAKGRGIASWNANSESLLHVCFVWQVWRKTKGCTTYWRATLASSRQKLGPDF